MVQTEKNSTLKFCGMLNYSLVQELSAKNDQLTAEIQKIQATVNSGVLQRQRVTSQHTGDSGQGQFK